MNAPTLIVGLGGTGSDIALRVSKMVSPEQLQRIGFAVFDTDVNELSAIKRKNPFVHTIQTSTKLSVGEYLDIDTHARDTWFPVNAILNSKTLTEGAGQVRAVSRMAFETAVRAGKMEELHKAIEGLYKLEGSEYQQALRVIIVSSLAGGTGSGLILPVALYIKNYLATHFRQSANITRGFFILPEVFFEVIQGQAERNNLKSNAYACLRELDAFLMKADCTLPHKYDDSVKIEFPSVTSGNFEEYKVRPFDFCFLFDAQNADGKKLNSFNEYLDHAASCIYSQSIGPMNKRSNSSEDNTIRKLAAERGRNRYAGAGCSILRYPVEDIKQYLALTWAKNCVSEQWLTYDAMFKEQVKANARKRNQGLRVSDIRADRAYIDSVESKAKNKDPFSMAVIDATAHFDETGFTKIADKWLEYLAALKEKVDEDNSYGQDDLDGQQSKARDSIAEIEAGSNDDAWSKYEIAYRNLQLYYNMIKRRTEDSAATIAYSIFRGDGANVTSDGLKFRLETYMRNSKKSFIHPSAVRYFLYKTLNSMQLELSVVEADVKAEADYMDNFESQYFDDGSTDDVVETVSDLRSTKKVTLADKLMKRLSADQEELKTAYSTYLAKCNDYRVDAVYAAVLEEGVKYVDEVCKSFEQFYQSLDSRIASIEKKIYGIEKKYGSTKGKATRYVCATKTCLEAMSERMPYTGGFIDIDSDLAETIYNRVRNYAMMDNKPENDSYFSNLFENDILGYFRNSLMSTYGEEVDKDIITAIECEGEYEHGIYGADELMEYVKRTYDEAKVLAAPFIEKPLGEEKDPINACTYNDELNPNDDSPRSNQINKELKNFGGEPDPDIPKNMIMFYKSFYGLRANDLSKFAPPQKAETYNRTGGEYFKAYYELIGKINPDPGKSKVITPHIDRWWHAVSMMPDLDDENQERQENDICAAFFWGLTAKYIQMFQDDTNNAELIYQLMLDTLKMTENDKTLLVSNGTACDRLYEVLDALYIYPELVEKILDRVSYEQDVEVNENKEIEETLLVREAETFRIPEYELGENKDVRSIFDIPMLLKKSMTTDAYDEEKVLRVLRAEISESKKYLEKFCLPKDVSQVVGDFFSKQFDRFIEDMEKESVKWKNIYSDYLFSRICDVIAMAQEELGRKKEAIRINKIKNELTK